MKKLNIKIHKGLCKILFFANIALFIVSLGSQVYLANKLALKGKELKELSEKKLSLEKDIARLEFDGSSISSLSYVETKARVLGFVDQKSPIRSVKVFSAVAMLPYVQ